MKSILAIAALALATPAAASDLMIDPNELEKVNTIAGTVCPLANTAGLDGQSEDTVRMIQAASDRMGLNQEEDALLFIMCQRFVEGAQYGMKELRKRTR
jgi:hypothetical protein